MAKQQYETEHGYAARQLAELFEDVFVSATGGRAMTQTLKTDVADRCYDVVATMMNAVDERRRREGIY